MRGGSLSGLRSRLLRSSMDKVKRGPKLLEEYVGRIVGRYPRSTIMLFGSRALERHLPHSDYDVAVVLEEVGDKLSVVEELRRLKPRGLPLDLIVLQVDELSDPLTSKMLEGSKVLYDGLSLTASSQRDVCLRP
ncbi:DNA polymerase subunit beta [Candidatus Geothermarchaeota archaeon ex4572_27]|nr:MAG: DNA polymerase subunit beta [Candidatus Geothermarchaeota archaeon ex4572_27]